MKKNHNKLKIIILSIYLPWQAIIASSTYENRESRFLEVGKDIELRWEKVKEI